MIYCITEPQKKLNCMRLLFVLLLTATSVFSQAQQITGLAKDENGTPLNGATVSLIKDSSTIKLAVSGANGSYFFSGIKEGNYKVMASHVGFKPALSPKFSVASSDVTVPELMLSKVTGNLGNVNV